MKQLTLKQLAKQVHAIVNAYNNLYGEEKCSYEFVEQYINTYSKEHEQFRIVIHPIIDLFCTTNYDNKTEHDIIIEVIYQEGKYEVIF